MILRVAAALALAVHTAPSPAPFEGMAEERMVVTHEGEEIDSSFRMFFTRTAWRMEMDIRPPHTSSPGARHELGSYEMFRLVAFGKIAEPTKAWLVNDRTRAYAVMVLDPAAHDLQEDAALWNITRRGKDRIAGLWCDNVTAQRIDQSESWDACLSSRLPRTAMESLNHIDVEGWLAAARRAGVEGHPLRAVWRGTTEPNVRDGSTCGSSAERSPRRCSRSPPAIVRRA